MYEDVVKALRNLLRSYKATDNGNCHQAKILANAADAIEELQKKYDGAVSDNKSLCRQIAELAKQRNEAYSKGLLEGGIAQRAEDEKWMPQWIPVTERLPKEEKKAYWVCTNTGYQCECRWTNNRFGIGALDEWGWSIFDIPQYQKVMAWMDLPEPYKPPKEET